MEEKEKPGAPARKKAYAKPALRKVPLRPEEAVLGNCKMSGSTGPLLSNCGPIACVTIGS